MGGARRRAVLPPSCSCSRPPTVPFPEKILMLTKCPLLTIRMLKCDLLNVIFARQHRHLGLFTFPNINCAASIERPKAKSASASARDRALPLDSVTSLSCTQQLNIKGPHLPRTKNLLLPVF